MGKGYPLAPVVRSSGAADRTTPGFTMASSRHAPPRVGREGRDAKKTPDAAVAHPGFRSAGVDEGDQLALVMRCNAETGNCTPLTPSVTVPPVPTTSLTVPMLDMLTGTAAPLMSAPASDSV